MKSNSETTFYLYRCHFLTSPQTWIAQRVRWWKLILIHKSCNICIHTDNFSFKFEQFFMSIRNSAAEYVRSLDNTIRLHINFLRCNWVTFALWRPLQKLYQTFKTFGTLDKITLIHFNKLTNSSRRWCQYIQLWYHFDFIFMLFHRINFSLKPDDSSMTIADCQLARKAHFLQTGFRAQSRAVCVN